MLKTHKDFPRHCVICQKEYLPLDDAAGVVAHSVAFLVHFAGDHSIGFADSETLACPVDVGLASLADSSLVAERKQFLLLLMIYDMNISAIKMLVFAAIK